MSIQVVAELHEWIKRNYDKSVSTYNFMGELESNIGNLRSNPQELLRVLESSVVKLKEHIAKNDNES